MDTEQGAPLSTSTQEPGPARTATDAYRHPAADIVRALGVDPARGLSAAEAGTRMEKHGRNRLAETRKESPLAAFVRRREPHGRLSSRSPAAGTP